MGQQTPTISDAGTYRSANLLIERHGADAPIIATIRVAEQIGFGDKEGRAVWLRILKAVDELLAKERPEGARVH